MNKIRHRQKSQTRQDGIAGGENAGIAKAVTICTDATGEGNVISADRVNGWSDRQVGV